MNDTLYNQILKWIPSKTLQKAIAESGRLSDMTMLSAAYYCAPDFTARMAMLGRLIQAFDGEMKSFVLRLQRNKILSQLLFSDSDGQAVYELTVREYDDAIEEQTYLCTSYEAALAQIQRHYEYRKQDEEDDWAEDATSFYRIRKRRLFSGTPMEQDSDILGEATFKSGGVLLDVDMWEGIEEAQTCLEECFACDRLCICAMPDDGEYRVEYPRFTKNADAVRFYQDGRWRFGVVLRWKEEPTDNCCVIPLCSAAMRYGAFGHIRSAYENIPAPFVDVISARELPEEMQETYAAFAAYETREYVGRRRSTGTVHFR